MCGRMALTLPKEAMVSLFEAVPANDLPATPNYNICPTDSIHAVTSAEGQRRLRPMRWGLLPKWYKAPNGGPLLINARAETVAEKPAFREAIRSRRCLIPASGFYEWSKDEDDNRLPWFVHRSDGAPMVFGGLWQEWQGEGGPLTTCAVVTLAAGEEMSRIHIRQPLVLAPEDWPLWLGEAGHGAATLMKVPPEGTLTLYRVDRAVNSNRAEGPGLLEPLEG
ncbi:SOS response-associated peptidase [Pseudoroseicyclus tamaricis]|uniref:Abasic site processing protein n=1 Tax=Pseudoroseicyclus tamaricis TaxID=2705421 RepID=A0A6B2JVH6_9RHOB|nr:SOS response-associated peptidase [Pseudoroseicyclus tamaricis]NDV02348.1 SOS response-associated peptidase [Pseudoroseicyclus tamaricis]